MKQFTIIKLVICYFICGIIYNLFFVSGNCDFSYAASIWSSFYYIVNYLFIAGLCQILIKKSDNVNDIIALISAKWYSIGISLVYSYIWLNPYRHLEWCNSRIGGVIVGGALWLLGFIVAYLTKKK